MPTPNSQPDTVTATELNVLGYAIEAYHIDVETEGYTNLYIRYRAYAPDGQLIAEDCTTATDAWNWARWHAAKQLPPAAR